MFLRAAGTGSQQEDAEFKKITLVEKDANSYTDADFKTDTEYKYKIVARSLKNVLSNDSNVITVRPLPVPPAPENVSFLAGNDALSISWGSAGENIFIIFIKVPIKGNMALIL